MFDTVILKINIEINQKIKPLH